jgi:hypothetical protein
VVVVVGFVGGTVVGVVVDGVGKVGGVSGVINCRLEVFVKDAFTAGLSAVHSAPVFVFSSVKRR